MTSLPPASRPTADPSREGRGTEDGGSEHALSLLEFPRVLALVARYASSEAGRRRVRELRPLVYPDAAEDALRVTGEMTRLYGRSGGWAPPVIPELDAELRRLAVEGAVLEGDALHGLSVLLASGESARRDVLEEEETLPGLAELARGLLRAPALREKLEDAVDESGAVRDEASPDLRRIRGELRGARSSLVGRLERFAARLRDPDPVCRTPRSPSGPAATASPSAARGPLAGRRRSCTTSRPAADPVRRAAGRRSTPMNRIASLGARGEAGGPPHPRRAHVDELRPHARELRAQPVRAWRKPIRSERPRPLRAGSRRPQARLDERGEARSRSRSSRVSIRCCWPAKSPPCRSRSA